MFMDMQINFPNLGIYLEHVGKSFDVFGFEIAFYGITMATGILTGYLIAAKKNRAETGRLSGSASLCSVFCTGGCETLLRDLQVGIL